MNVNHTSTALFRFIIAKLIKFSKLFLRCIIIIIKRPIKFIMKYLTDEKLLIVGAGGMIGSNMAQTAIMMHLTPNICLYDPYAKGLEGVAEELLHCGFEGLNLTYTDDIETAFTGAKYIVSSGGAPRKAAWQGEVLQRGKRKIPGNFAKT